MAGDEKAVGREEGREDHVHQQVHVEIWPIYNTKKVILLTDTFMLA
jgi:hypothetical protein